MDAASTYQINCARGVDHRLVQMRERVLLWSLDEACGDLPACDRWGFASADAMAEKLVLFVLEVPCYVNHNGILEFAKLCDLI